MQSSIKKLNDETLLVHADIDSSRHAIELENKEKNIIGSATGFALFMQDIWICVKHIVGLSNVPALAF